MIRYCSSNSNVHSLNEMTDKTQNQYLDISQSGSCKECVKKSSYAFLLVKFFLTTLQIRIVDNFKIFTRIILIYFEIIKHI